MQIPAAEQFVGQRVGNCVVEQLLGQGRLNAVYAGRQYTPLQRPVAITVFIPPEQLSDRARQRFMARFLKEAASLVRLEHQYILPIYEYGEVGGCTYLITPYMASGSLADVLKAKGICSPTYVYRVLKQMAEALDYAHNKGILHQALKPANILLHPEQRVQVSGFGLINLLQLRGIEYSDYTYAHLLSVAGTYLGSPEYIAPEFVQGQYVDERVDIYALGIMLFELLCGRPPFVGSNPIEVALMHVQQMPPSILSLRPDLPEGINTVVQKAIQKNPRQRYQSAQELLEPYTSALALSQQQQRQPATQSLIQERIPSPDELFLTNASSKWQAVPDLPTAAVPNTPPTGIPAAPMTFLQQPGSTRGMQLPSSPIPFGRGQGSREGNAPAQPSYMSSPGSKGNSNGQQSYNDLDSFAWWSGIPKVRQETPLVAVKSSTPRTDSEGKPIKGEPIKFEPLELDQMADSEQVPSKGDAKKIAKAKAKQAAEEERAAKKEARLAAAEDKKAAKKEAEHILESASNPTTMPKERVGRRRAVALIGSGVAAAAVLGSLGFADAKFTHLVFGTKKIAPMGTMKQNTPANGNNAQKNTPDQKNGQQQQLNQNNQNNNQNQQKVQNNAFPVNSSQNFTNKADGQDSIAIHLPDGRFVAYERACTHVGIKVNYDPDTHMIVCPGHGSIFDPGANAKVIQGPAMTPLAPVAIKVNADGTIVAANA